MISAFVSCWPRFPRHFWYRSSDWYGWRGKGQTKPGDHRLTKQRAVWKSGEKGTREESKLGTKFNAWVVAWPCRGGDARSCYLLKLGRWLSSFLYLYIKLWFQVTNSNKIDLREKKEQKRWMNRLTYLGNPYLCLVPKVLPLVRFCRQRS